MKRIAIVGTAQTSREAAPYDDPSWDIWNIGINYMLNKRFTLWLELHSPEVLRAANASPAYFDFLRRAGDKVICGSPTAELPSAVPYPLDAIRAEFGDYFTCSAAWMIAYAVQQKADEIGLWGIDMMDASEYSHQRPCCEYYLGIARGKGIAVTIAPQSPLLRSHGMYAFSDLKFSREMTERRNDLEAAMQRHKIVMQESERQYYETQAQLRQITDINNRWGL